jgi:hypothetical protein
MDTVRIEFMLVNTGGVVIQNWTTAQSSVENNPQVYLPRAVHLQDSHIGTNYARVRVVSEQTNRIVDLLT